MNAPGTERGSRSVATCPPPKRTNMISTSGCSFQMPSAFCRSGVSVRSSGGCEATSLMNPDFLDLLRAFVAADVRFLIVGAYALALHGRPRATGDLDVWIEASPENAQRVMRALAVFGAPIAEISG